VKPGPPGSLRTKLLGIVLVTTLVALIVALCAMVGYDVRLYQQAWVADMDTQAQLIGRTTAAALTFDDSKVARENLDLLRFRPQVRAAAIYNARGGIFASYAASPAEQQIPTLPEAEGVRIDGHDLVVFKRIVDNSEILGTVYLRADYQLYDRILSYAGIAVAVLVLAMLVALAMSAWLQRIVTRPILAIGEIARDVLTRQDYSQRAIEASDDEVGMLVESFNAMLAEIERRSVENEAAKASLALEVEERTRSEDEVLRLNTELEDRVRERTAQLEASNVDLAQARKDAEDANRAKSEFLSSMSHELRTPLNAILGFGHILASEVMPTTPAQKIEFANHIVRAGRHLLTLINEILDLAKIESGTVSLSLEPVLLSDLMRECQSMTEPMGNERGLRMTFPASNTLAVVADRTRLKQVLLNLLSNSIKYNRADGAVLVYCALTDSQCVRISVQDTGIGLRPEQLESLFLPFNRLGQEGGSEEGTGIGLVVTKKLIELMGGTIGVTSSPGVGSVFWIELKSTKLVTSNELIVAHQATAVVKTSHDDALLPSLLYVEDNPANLSLVAEIIRFRADVRLLSAPDARLGIQLARAHLPRVILMDLNLPGISGTDALKILRGNPETAHIPVIAVTANAMPRDIARGLSDGFFRYVTKPLVLDELNKAIDSALEFTKSAERQSE
jgi:signal transduction histidine kinase/CheY-like chemotaxis protein